MNQLTTKEIQESAEKVMLGLNREYGREIFKMSEPSMNQIKLKIEEIGLSQREISVRLGKNPSYLAGVFRSGLSTAKQAELLERLEVVAGGGTVQSDDEIIAELSQKLADTQDAGIKALEGYGIARQQLTETQKYLLEANQECEQIESKYRAVLISNYVLSLVILGVAISWVLK
jgi:transcriptional regulator with XRE-family HTH domain